MNLDQFSDWIATQTVAARVKADQYRREVHKRAETSATAAVRYARDAIVVEAALSVWREMGTAFDGIATDHPDSDVVGIADDFLAMMIQSAIGRLEGADGSTSGYVRAIEADQIGTRLAILDEIRRTPSNVEIPPDPKPEPVKATPEAIGHAIDEAREADEHWRKAADRSRLLSDRMPGGAPGHAVRLAREFVRATGRRVEIISIDDRNMTVRLRLPFGDGRGGASINLPGSALQPLKTTAEGDGTIRCLDAVLNDLVRRVGPFAGGDL